MAFRVSSIYASLEIDTRKFNSDLNLSEESVKHFTANSGKRLERLRSDFAVLAKELGFTPKQIEAVNKSFERTVSADNAARALGRVGAAAGLSTVALRQMQQQLGISANQGLAARFNADNQAAQAYQQTLGRLKAAAVGYLGLNSLRDIARTSISIDSVEKSFFAITGSMQGARAEMAWIREEAQRLGLDFFALADSFKGFSAAGKTAGMEASQVKEIFTAVTEASAVMGLSSDRTKLALYALEQMISKGAVSMEELRRQLGDQLPGAFQLAAKAMGYTTEKFAKLVETGQIMSADLLPKLAAKLKEVYGPGLAEAMKTPRAEIQRLLNEITFAKTAIGGGGFLSGLAEAAKDIRAALQTDDMQANLQRLGYVLGQVVGGIGKVGSVLLENGDKLVTLLPIYAAATTAIKVQKSATDGLIASKRAAIAGEVALRNAAAQTAKANLDATKATIARIQAEMRLPAVTTGIAQIAKHQRVLIANEAAYVTAIRASTVATLAKTGAMATLKAAGAGVLSIFGGPWGLAFTAAAGAVFYLSTRQSEGERIGAKYADMLAALKLGGEAATAAIEDLRDKIRGMSQDQLKFTVGSSEREAAALINEFLALRERGFKEMQVGPGFLPGMVDFKADSELNKAINAFVADVKTKGEPAVADFVDEINRIGEANAWSSEQVKKFADSANALWFVLHQAQEARSWLGQVKELVGGDSAAEKTRQAELERIREATKATQQLYTQTTEFKKAQMESALATAKANNETLKSAESLAVLKKAQADLAAFNNKSGKARASADDGLKRQQAALLAVYKLTDPVKAHLQEVENAFAQYQKNLKASGLSPEEQARLLPLGRKALEDQMQRFTQAEQALQDFEKQYQGVFANAGLDSSISTEMDKFRMAAKEAFGESRLSAGEYYAVLSRIDELQGRKLEESSTDWFDGLKRGLRSVSEETGNMAKNMESVVTGVFNNLGQAFSLTTEGMKVDWKSMLDSMLNQAFQAMVVNPLMSGLTSGLGNLLGGSLGSLFGGKAAVGGYSTAPLNLTGVGALHGGGMVGERPAFTRPVALEYLAAAPRFHGGKLPWNPASETPAILRNDEAVLTPGQLRAVAGLGNGASGAGVQVNVAVNNSLGDEAEVSTAQKPNSSGGVDLELMVKRIYRSDVAQGGINRYLQSGGWKQRPVGR